MSDWSPIDHSRFYENGGTYGQVVSMRGENEVRNGSLPVYDISIIVPFVTFSMSLKKLASKSAHQFINSILKQHILKLTAQPRIFVLWSNGIDSYRLSAQNREYNALSKIFVAGKAFETTAGERCCGRHHD